MIQKEEERARKKIQETKERAAEILALRQENEKRVQAYVHATDEVKQLQQVLLAKNREQDQEGKKARMQRLQILHSKKKEEVGEMVMEKKYLSQLMIEEQQRAIEEKQRRREEIRRMEEEIKAKKERERQEKERRRKEFYERKLAEEAEEAKRAEKLVKALEKKEREWIDKLRKAQSIQDSAFDQLETALNNPVQLRASISKTSDDMYATPHSQKGNSSSRAVLSPIEQEYQEYVTHTANVISYAGANPKSSNQSHSSGGEHSASSHKQQGRSASTGRTMQRNNSSGALVPRNMPGLKGRSGHK